MVDTPLMMLTCARRRWFHSNISCFFELAENFVLDLVLLSDRVCSDRAGKEQPGTYSPSGTFKNSRSNVVVMNPEKFAVIFLLITVLAACSGCTGSSGTTPPTKVLTPDTITPVKTPATLVTLLPSGEVARMTVEHFGMNPATENIYEFIGKVQIDDGPYRSVRVILRYPDTQEYAYDAGGMGGSNATVKPFYLYPDNRYMGTNPEKIIELDGKQYATVYRYENGVLAWVALRENSVSG